MARPKSVVLLSGGLDSTVATWMAVKETDCVLALTFDYGQRAAAREVRAARAICERLSIPHKVISLPWFQDFTETALVNTSSTVPVNMHLDNETETRATAKAVWVPNRNGIFLNIAAAFAESLGAKWIIPGFNVEEAETFPDNSTDYMRAATGSLFYSTANHIEVTGFTQLLTKPEIVNLGREIEVDFSLVWPCYFGDEKPCGRCESCLRFARAMGS